MTYKTVLGFRNIPSLISEHACAPQHTIRVSKSFAAGTKDAQNRIYKHLHQSYLANPTLKSYIQLNPRADVATDFAIVRDVYTRVLTRARTYAPVAPVIDSLDANRLEGLSQDADLVAFFMGIANCKPSAQDFLDHFGKNIDICNRAGMIRIWMVENSGMLSRVSDLYFNYRLPLVSLPKEVSFMTGLTSLRIISCKLTTLPSEIANLKKLQRCILTGNVLTALPPQIGELTQLTKLYVSHNKIETLPAGIANLNQLEKLDLRNNHFKEFPENLRGFLAKFGITDLTHLT